MQRQNGPTKTIWVTKEGERIPVKKMDDRHLLNTIRFLRRNALMLHAQQIKDAYEFSNTIFSEEAFDCHERYIRILESMTEEEFLEDICITYNALVAEAKKRRLEV